MPSGMTWPGNKNLQQAGLSLNFPLSLGESWLTVGGQHLKHRAYLCKLRSNKVGFCLFCFFF